MSFTKLQDMAQKALAGCQDLGFDRLTVGAAKKRLLGIRLAQGVVCRENVAKDDSGFEVQGLWQGRAAQLSCQAADEAELLARIRQLRRDIELQSPDKEHVAPVSPKGSVAWDVAPGDFEALYGVETIYPLLAKHAERARKDGLRVTGYLEAQEVHSHSFANGTAGAFDLRTRDSGLTLSLTVDRDGAVGTTSRASVHAPPAELDRMIGEALDEAAETCRTSSGPTELSPGDYTVVMHPAAVLDFVQSALSYGLFDRRKIDEGRTYLSGKLAELAFPAGLRLAETLNLTLPTGVYADLPLNHRSVPCAGLDLISGGHVRDLHVTPFWAKERGASETFAPGYGPPLCLSAQSGSVLSGRHADLAALIKDTERGVYIANTWYLRMVAEMEGTITGMTRDGLYAIRDGKLAGPLINMRWHDNPFRMLQAVTGLTDSKLLLGRSRLAGGGRSPLAYMPGLRLDAFHFSSATKF